MESGVESIKSFIKLFEEKENCELFYFTNNCITPLLTLLKFKF